MYMHEVCIVIVLYKMCNSVCSVVYIYDVQYIVHICIVYNVHVCLFCGYAPINRYPHRVGADR